MGGGGKGGTTTQSVQIPPEVLARYNAVNARAENVAQQPFQPYAGQFVAPLTGTQQAGVSNISRAAGMAQPYFGAAAGLTAAGSQAVGPLTQQQIQYYQNPFTQAVVDPTIAAMQQEFGQQRAQQQASAIRAGAFGGDRSGIERANLMRQQGLGMAQAIAPLYSQGYGMGVQTAAGQQGVVAQDLQRQLAAGQQFAGLGAGAQQAALQGAQAQLGAGTLEQQTQQADLTARYQQFLQERGYPFQVAQFLANIAMGTGALSGSTTTTTQPSSFFSDERMKENIKPIGETFDGQTIYKYNYKGEPGTQIGLIAQEVEHRKPEAVGMAGGMKTVDYDRATEEAGGIGKALASMGGAVREPGAYARGGFAPGGLVDPNDLNALIASQREALGPFGQSGLYGQKSDGAPFGGAGGIVPTSRLPVPKLVTAGPAPRQQEGGLRETMQDIAQVGKMTEKLGTGLDKLGKLGMSEEALKAATEPSVGQRMSEAGKTLSDIFGFAQRKNGGGVRPHYAAGGAGINPYGSKNDPMDYFPEEVLESGSDKTEALKPAPAPSGGGGSGFGVGDAVKIAATVLPMFMSDRRLKHDVEPIGKTYDGQNIYRYHMGDGAMRMGLMAQEVAGRKPEAVAKGPEGYLMLDYDRATEDAVPRRGGVMPREGLQAGGVPEEDPTFPLLREKEGFRERPYYDVNAYRVGYGSDTITTPEGRVVPVTKEMTVTREDAERDLARRVNEYQGQIRGTLGEERFNALPAQARAALTSVAYNYGRLPESVARAAAEGDPAKIAAAVNALGTHNEGINARRRAAEAAMIDPTGSYAAMRAQAAGVKPSEGLFGGPPIRFGTKTAQNPQGEQFKSYGDFFTSRQFIQPALVGLATMASSPSRYLGSAILQGLGGASDAYSNLEKQMSGIEQAKALTQQVGAATREQEAATVRGNIMEKNGRLIVQYVDPKTGRYVTIDGAQYLRLPPDKKPSLDPRDVQRLEADAASRGEGRPAGTPPAGGVKPADATTQPGDTATQAVGLEGAATVVGAPATPADGGVVPTKPISSPSLTVIAPDENALRAAEAEAREIELMTFKEDREKVLETNRALINQAISSRDGAFAITAGLNDVAKPLAGLAAGEKIAPGAFAKLQYLVVDKFNSALDALGLPDDLKIAPGAQTQFQLAEKASAALREAKQRTSDLRAISALEELEKSIADPQKTKEAAADILAASYVDKQKMADQGMYTLKYARSQPVTVARGASEAYKKQYTEEQYNMEKAVIKKLLLDNINGIPMISYLLKSGDAKLDPAIAARITPQSINEMYGVDVARYFLNSAK